MIAGDDISARVEGKSRPNLMTQHAPDSGAQVLPPARATVPRSLRESSSRASSLLACYALGPPASAAPVRLDRAAQRGAAFAITRASRRARTRSIGSL